MRVLSPRQAFASWNLMHISPISTQSTTANMKCYTNSSQPWNIPSAHNFYFCGGDMLAHPVQMSILELEKELLETRLADCVTYLQVLRKKQARSARQLDSDSPLSLKKRKKIRQGMRELEKAIKNGERDEQAFLNNLQACKANIYLAETVSSPSTTVSSTIPDLASDSTLSSCPEESEPTERSWTGCPDKAAQSPHQVNLSISSFVNDMVPNESSGTGEVEQASTPKQFMFSPEAAVFQPLAASKGQHVQLDQQLTTLHL